MQDERLTPKDLVETINMPQGSDTTRMLLYARKLWELENQIEQGELVKLPCKVGDTVYYVNCIIDSKLPKEKSIRFFITDHKIHDDEHLFVAYQLLTEKAFLTRAEAEKRMEELTAGQRV